MSCSDIKVITATIKIQGLYKSCGKKEKRCFCQSHLSYSAVNALGGARLLSQIPTSVPTWLLKDISSANKSTKIPAGSAVGATAGQIQERK